MQRAVVVGEGADEVARMLTAMGREAETADSLTDDALGRSTVVVLLGGDRLTPAAAEVLAAGKVLVTTPSGPYGGLQPGVQFLGADSLDRAVEQANMALVHPDAVQMMRVLGRVAATRGYFTV